ncbi:MAG: tRNA (guanosine(46)-N7)-methyltransferase TrmB [Bacteroidales bacterium]|nr:tRNA (guanosine(46)-N7)-methyltransferase TrmB [Bacteroidales bacterium]
MGHGKLRKFAENETFGCLLQPDASSVLVKDGSKALVLRDHPIKGHWIGRVFSSPGPIVLELGCGKGDYTIALAERHPEMNFIGVDIKGARLWKGAKYATERGLKNVAFLRTRIEFIGAFFGPDEVSRIWLTFSDPQLKSENARLTSPLFLERYRAFLAPGGLVCLKTDSRFLYEYTQAVVRANGLRLLASSTDIYAPQAMTTPDRRSATPPSLTAGPLPLTRPRVVPPGKHAFPGYSRVATGPEWSQPEGPVTATTDWAEVTGVQTFYESMFLKMGLPITYMEFTLEHEGPFVHPTDFDSDYWRKAEGPRRTFSHNPTKL